VKTVWGAGPDARFQVAQRFQVASQLRKASRGYRAWSLNESFSLDVRKGYRNASESLRGEAEKLEKQAAQMKAVF
jgi:hypothetical protein